MEQNEILTMLEEEYRNTLRDVAEASDEPAHTLALKKLETLGHQLNDRRKEADEQQKMLDEWSFKDRSFRRDFEMKEKEIKIREEELKGKKLDRWIQVGLGALSLIVPTACSWIWMRRGMQFEETGTFTSRTGKWVSDNFRLFKGKNG